MVDWDREARKQGNTSNREDDAEAARVGRPRTPDDIPKQGDKTRKGFVPSNVNPGMFKPSSYETFDVYRLGPPLRPRIQHDNGFSGFKRRAPTAMDYVSLAKWKAMLNGAEAMRPDLTDACASYRHFLEGRGAKRHFSYERYATSDASGQATLRNAILDFQDAVLALAEGNPTLARFDVTGPAIPCGSDPLQYPYLSYAFPYPATENWQKAIGGHVIWLSGKVEITRSPSMSAPVFRATMDLHAEDRFNFNPGNVDVATGIPDDDNGMFETTGLGHQFDHFGSLRRLLEWRGCELGVQLSARPHTTRLRQPTNNLRLRNRI
jgi:hypothetical protein